MNQDDSRHASKTESEAIIVQIILERDALGSRAPSLQQYAAQYPQLAHEIQQLSDQRILQRYLNRTTSTPPVDASCEPTEPFRGEPTPTAAALPSAVGKYVVKELLGQGGQATTYKALDPDLKRHVVLKVYRRRSEEADTNLMREGQALARVTSPHVVRCFAVDRDEHGQPYLVMEYVPGQALSAIPTTLKLSTVMRIVEQLAEGLAAVHACGLIHRDIKPHNVLLGDDGIPRLIDFGLAKPILIDLGDSLSGTLAYMSPEQARGDTERIDSRTDIFGLGSVFYYLLTGRPLYVNTDKHALLRAAQAADFPAVAELNPQVGRGLQRLVMRCLAKEPGNRFESARDLQRALAQYRATRLWSRRILFLCLSAILAGIAWSTTHGLWNQDRTTVSRPHRPMVHSLDSQSPITVTIVGPQQETSGLFRMTEGQALSFRIQTTSPCYIGIWDEAADGTVTQLMPNLHQPDNFIQPGTSLLIPADDSYQISAVADEQPSTIRVTASSRPWDSLAGDRVGPYVIYQSPDELENFRGFKLQARKHTIHESTFRVKVEPQGVE